MFESRQSSQGRYVGRSATEYGPFKGRDGETVHGYHRFLYLVDDDLNVTSIKCDEELFDKAGAFKLGQPISVTAEMRARQNKLEPRAVSVDAA